MATQFLPCTNPHVTGFWSKYAVGFTRFVVAYITIIALMLSIAVDGEHISIFVMFVVSAVGLLGGLSTNTLRPVPFQGWAEFCNKYGVWVYMAWIVFNCIGVGSLFMIEDGENFLFAAIFAVGMYVVNTWPLIFWVINRKEILAGIDAVRNIA